MAIKKYYSVKAKAGWRFDAVLQKYWSWGFDLSVENRQRLREHGFATKQLAENAAARIMLARKEKKYNLYTRRFPQVSELFEKRLSTIPEGAEKTRSKRVLETLLSVLPEQITLDQVSTANIQKFVELRLLTVKPPSVNRELKIVRATLNLAEKFFDVEDYKVCKMPFVKTPLTRRENVINSSDAKRIIEYLLREQAADDSHSEFEARRRAGLFFLLSLVTGARPGELVRLKREDILEDLNALKITGTKTEFKTAKTIRYFPLVPILKKILDEAQKIQGKYEFIFTEKGTLTNSYYDKIKEACEAVGIKYGKNTKGGFVPYDLRHTATTAIMQAGTDFETVANVTGQSKEVLWHYTHANQNSINSAVAVLEKFAENCLPETGL
jgi:integrase